MTFRFWFASEEIEFKAMREYYNKFTGMPEPMAYFGDKFPYNNFFSRVCIDTIKRPSMIEQEIDLLWSYSALTEVLINDKWMQVKSPVI